MPSHSPVFLLAALGALSLSATATAAESDPAQWKCETCPYPKSASGSVSAGIGGVSQPSSAFGDQTGLQRKGSFAVLSGSIEARGADGVYASAEASDLGLDTRRLEARAGQDGRYQVYLGYSELPRWLSTGAATPFLGVGSATLTLPPGYPAGGTGTMPLASTLAPLEIGYRLKRYDLGGSLVGDGRLSFGASLHRDERHGTRLASGSFFANAEQLAAPVSEQTDRLLLTASYAGRELQLGVGYELSQFRNGNASLTWANPFVPVVAGAGRGQLALAPANDFQQLTASAGYTISPTIRASVNLAAGRLTQNAAFVPPTLNAALSTLATLPATSLDGRVDTFSGSVRLTAALRPDLLLTAAYAHDRRDNRTAARGYRIVATDLFIETAARSNTPFDTRQDRVKLSADYRPTGKVQLSAGADENDIERSYQEVVNTRETTLWGRGTFKPLDSLALALRLARADRRHSTYGTAIWFSAPENPLLRKFNLAARRRDTTGLRADYALSETVSMGGSADYAYDDYHESQVGLRSARSVDFGLDLTAAWSEQTRISAFWQGERVRSHQLGSSTAGSSDWNAQNQDRFDTFGLNVRHAAIPDKLDLGAEVNLSRARSSLAVVASGSDPGFPAAKNSVERIKLWASYKLQSDLWLDGSLLHEHLRTTDWHRDGLLPATVPNLLAFGSLPPNHDASVVQLSLRYRF